MIGWKKICCAVDFESPSRMAMEQAVDLAKRFDAELTLVHVLLPPLSAESDVLVSSRGIAAEEARRDEQRLAEWRAGAERRLGRPVRSRTLSGDPAGEIVSHVREERYDLVVVGTHGRTGVRRAVLGSVAERIARQSPCPVLVGHDEAAHEKEEIASEAALYR
jgi:nucleotide-binding universal stress UspA family protein